jgi:DNA-binding NarL/FixJ family response regulator
MSTGADEPTRIVLADDHRLFRESLKLFLEKNGCEVVGQASTAEEAVALAGAVRPHVIAMDLEMPGIGGLAGAHRIRQNSPASKVIVVSAYDDEEFVLEALTEAGAAGYMLKSDSAQDMLNGIRAVADGKHYLSPSIAPILLSHIKSPRAPGSRNARLTRREREVLRLLGQGATSKEIAQKLGISPKTAQAHRENLKQKLNLRTTAEMVRYAIKHKIVRLD